MSLLVTGIGELVTNERALGDGPQEPGAEEQKDRRSCRGSPFRTEGGTRALHRAGCTSSMQLYRELLALGYVGGYHVVNRYVTSIRKGVAIPTLVVTPSPRTITSWIMRPQETLRPSDTVQLETVRNACP